MWKVKRLAVSEQLLCQIHQHSWQVKLTNQKTSSLLMVSQKHCQDQGAMVKVSNLEIQSFLPCVLHLQVSTDNVAILISSFSSSEELLQYGGDKYLKVPVPHGQVLSNSNMRDTCTKANLKPLCWSKDPNHEYSTSECSVGNLPGENWSINNRKLAELLCPGSKEPCDCPILDRVFFFAHNWRSPNGHERGAAGVMVSPVGGSQNWHSVGLSHKSGYDGGPLYSACVKEPGLLLCIRSFFALGQFCAICYHFVLQWKFIGRTKFTRLRQWQSLSGMLHRFS